MSSLIYKLLSFVNDEPRLMALFIALGFFTLARFIFQTFSVVMQTFILPGQNLKRFGAKRGAWAVVTGATDGIGKEFAYQLAKAGFNVFLVARNKEILAQTASGIELKYKVSTATHSIDFAKADDTAYSAFTAAVADMNVGVLVNNVGKSHAMPTYLVDTPLAEMKDIISININATLRVTYAVLPGMIQRRQGLILNIGSMAGAVPSPMLATYSGTKAFLSTFSGALGEEVKRHHIVVEHVNTYFVVSKLSKIRRPSLMIPNPGPYVAAVLAKVGLACGAAYSGRPNTSSPYWSHALLDYLITLVGMPGLFISYTHGLHKDIRRRALAKAAREVKKE